MLILAKLINWILGPDLVDDSGLLIHVTEALPIGNYVLALSFNNGDTGVVDLVCYLERQEGMAPLQDVEFFRRVEIEDGMLRWPGGIQIDAVTLHQSVMTSWPTQFRLSRSVAQAHRTACAQQKPEPAKKKCWIIDKLSHYHTNCLITYRGSDLIQWVPEGILMRCYQKIGVISQSVHR